MSNSMQLLERAFSPSAPITSNEFFSGRYDQLNRAVEAINQRGQHFVVFGERGVGKTSFANIVCTQLQNVVSSKVTCNREDDFKQLWRRAFSTVRFSRDHRGIGFIAETSTELTQLDLFLHARDDIDLLDFRNILNH